MTSTTTLDLFLTLFRRPHTQCLHHLQHLRSAPSLTRHYTKQPLPQAPAQSRSALAAKVPLHVGLDRNPANLSAISRIPIPRGVRGESFTPSIISRPLGVPYPPEPGQNSPYDERSWSERRADFGDREKALERRRVYLRSYLRPYFQEWKRMDFHKGKVFRSNERMFRREKALWFPNVVGETLVESEGVMDSCTVMRGKVSVVAMHSAVWAEEQVGKFVDAKENEELEVIIRGSAGLVQRVNVNMQQGWFRTWLARMFKGRIRRLVDEERWARYFIIQLPRDIRRGLQEETRDAMGLLNSQVGYVYLVDSDCKIRWAASAYPWEGEVEGLNKAVKRLIEEERQLNARTVESQVKKPTTAATSKGPVVAVA